MHHQRHMLHWITLTSLILAGGALGQEARYKPIRPIPLGDLLLTLPTTHPTGAKVWDLRFSHRFNQSLDQGDGGDRVRSFLGLDGSADIAIGITYAPTRDLAVSLLRSSSLDDFELAAKYVVVQQAPALPFSLALRAGGDFRTEQDVGDRSSVFAQAIVSHQFGDRVEVTLVPTFATNAGRAASGDSSAALFRHAFNVPAGVALAVSPRLTIVGEILPVNRDLPDGMHGDPGWALGLKTAVGGHFFEILVTNNTATHVAQYVSSTYLGAPLQRGDIHLGFNIERRFGGK